MNNIQYLVGARITANRGSIGVNTVYSYASSTGAYSTITTGLPASVYNALTCSCTNALKEVDYTLYYTPQGDGSFTADSITVNAAFYDSLTLNSAYCSSTTLQSTAATVQ